MTRHLAVADLQHFDDIEQSFAVVGIVLNRWHSGRQENTAFIAKAVGIAEHDVCRIIAADQNRRYAARRATA